ncbi:MAG: flagellar basal body P-ring protein FlgI [Planctomycetota bacterium]
MIGLTWNPYRLALASLAICLANGCSSLFVRPASTILSAESEPDSSTTLISNVAHPYGLGYIKVEAISMATGLAGTGEDPAPSPQRAALMDEMQRREVEDPNQVLASPDTALVLVRGFLRPGIQAGDRFDVEVRTSSRSEATSLRGGHLLETRLSETAVLGEQLRTGHLMAMANGAVLVDPTADASKEPRLSTKGRVLGGGVVMKSRNLGLILDHDRQSIRLSQKVGKAINNRFHSYIDGQKQGVATPKTDEFVELVLHPRYKDNVGRYMRVVRNLAIDETATDRQARLQLLTAQLLDPVTSATAALRLEAIGGDAAVEVLSEGLTSTDAEVRFYSAEALAYLDETKAVAVLSEVVRREPAFRVNALAALSAMDDGSAYDSLRTLLSVKSAETRYGAFRAITSMAPKDSFTHGEDMRGMFSYHVLDVAGPPMVHATSSHRPEIVMFGKHHALNLPLVLDAGPKILVNGLTGGQIKVSQFDGATDQRTVPNDVEAVIRAVVELGGTYPDVVQMLQQANSTGALTSRFRVNALPEGGREFLKDELKVASSN